MRRMAVLGLVLIGAVMIVWGMQEPVPVESESAVSVIDVRRIRRPVEVMGTVNIGNLPATQNVAGTVAVNNLPAVQTVAGAVDVSNLPVDSDGNLRVAGSIGSCPSVVRFVGFTQANLDWTAGVLEASRACSAEFPGSRVCEYFELMASIPPPPVFPTPGAASVAFRLSGGSDPLLDIRCVLGDGDLEIGGCGHINIYTLPVACCGL